MKIPFIDLGSQYSEISKEAKRLEKALMKRCDFILGHDVKEFESNFAKYIGAKFAIGVNSGTDALFLSLLSLGIGPGDEVIVPAFTYIASAFAVSYTGAKPVFADIDKNSFNIDPDQIRSLITKRTKAIMPVHLYGQTADMGPITKIAKQYGLKIVEDAAQAHGAQYGAKYAGNLGDLGCFSFYPTKNLGALGDAGLITTNSEHIYERLKKLRDYGRKTRYVHNTLGYNSRMDSIQAMYLNIKLKKLDAWNNKRIKAAMLYCSYLEGVRGIELPSQTSGFKHVFHIFAIKVKNRDKVIDGLKKYNISAAVHYPVPLHLQEVYACLGYKKGDFPVAESVSESVLCLPIYPHIRINEIRYVAQKLKGLVKNG